MTMLADIEIVQRTEVGDDDLAEMLKARPPVPSYWKPGGPTHDAVVALMKQREAMLRSWRRPHVSNHQRRRKRLHAKRAR